MTSVKFITILTLDYVSTKVISLSIENIKFIVYSQKYLYFWYKDVYKIILLTDVRL